jgi:prepilin-type N-terminal cleavage/methylation domain-containing protein
MQFSRQRGFTIVELLIVIVIIGILAALVIVSYNGITERANSTKVISTAKAFIKALNMMYNETGVVPGLSSCIAPASVVTGNNCPSSQGWYSNTLWDPVFNQNLLTYSGAKNYELGKWCSNPVGSMWYHANYYGDNRAVFQYCVGPNTNCGLPGVLSPPESEMVLSGANYTNRSSTYTDCKIQVFKW